MNSTSTIVQAIRLVRRELRGGLRGFGVFLTCLFLGVFAISAIGSFTESAKAALLADASALLGGDLEIRLAHRELPAEGLSFLTDRGQLSHVTTMRTMVVDIDDDKRVLAELKAIDSHYPLYGKITINPQLNILLFHRNHGSHVYTIHSRARRDYSSNVARGEARRCCVSEDIQMTRYRQTLFYTAFPGC